MSLTANLQKYILALVGHAAQDDCSKQSVAEQACPVNDGIYPEKMVFWF